MESGTVVVIGAGIIGTSIAYYLARAGIDVTLIDRRGPLSSGTASQACAGGVRHQGRAACEIPLAIHSIDLWATLEEELDADIGYRRNGMTVVTDDASMVPFLKRRVSVEQSIGLDVRMIYNSDLHDLVPGLSPPIFAGSFCPLDGQANPLRTISTLTTCAARLGVRFKWNCPAEHLVVNRKKIVSVKTSKGEIFCRYAILAAGAWSGAIAATAGLNLPIDPFGLQMMVTVRRRKALDQVLGWVGHGISLKQSRSGGFIIGGGWPGYSNPGTYVTRLYPGSMAKSAKTAVDLFPNLGLVPVIRAWVGIEAFCKDELQILSLIPDIDGLILATGFSGHGFALGPGVGSLLAEYLTTGKWPEMLAPFAISRFKKASRRIDNDR